jgi:hypothetical protein
VLYARGNRFVNTGGGAAGGAWFAIGTTTENTGGMNDFGANVSGNLFENLRGGGVIGLQIGQITHNVFANLGSNPIYVPYGAASYGGLIENNTIVDPNNTAIYIADGVNSRLTIRNNIIAGVPTGQVGIRYGGGTVAEGDLLARGKVDYNFFYDMTGDEYANYNGGPNDHTFGASPFVNPGAGDYRLNDNNPGGAEGWAAAFPTSIGGVANNRDVGALQHADPAGGGGGGGVGIMM